MLVSAVVCCLEEYVLSDVDVTLKLAERLSGRELLRAVLPFETAF
jgi:hypothetical protein